MTYRHLLQWGIDFCDHQLVTAHYCAFNPQSGGLSLIDLAKPTMESFQRVNRIHRLAHHEG